LKNDWEQTQIKVFSRWTAKQLAQRQIQFDSVLTDFKDGTKLINLLEIVSKEPIGVRYHKAPKQRIMMRENCSFALQFIQKKGIKLIGIGEDDIIDGHPKLTLGLIWTIINKFLIEDISVEEATARDALLIWAKKNTQGYADVNVTNFTTSWSSGLAFCALINKFRPQLLDYNALDRADHMEACRKAFAACKELGIYVYLDPEDLVGTQPDEKSVVTQVAEFFHFFAGESKTQAMADKLKRTIGIQRAIQEIVNNYEKEAQETIDVINQETEKLNAKDYEQTVPSVKGKLVEVIKFGRVARPMIAEKRGKALKTWGQLVTKCNGNHRPIPTPKEGLEPEALTKRSDEIEAAATQKRADLTEELNNLQNALIEAYDKAAEVKVQACTEIKEKSDNLQGTLTEQKEILAGLLAQAEEGQGKVNELQPQYDELVELRLATRVQKVVMVVQNEYDQLVAVINRLIELNKSALFDEENKARIQAYNDAAAVYVKEVAELAESIKAIEGSSQEKRAAFIAKQEEVIQKREGVANLRPIFEALEKDSLHLGIQDTPDTILALYTNELNNCTTEIENIHQTLVAEFDAMASEIDAKIQEIEKKADALEGPVAEQQQGVEKCQEELTQTRQTIEPTLNESYQYLVSCKVANRVKNSPTDLLNNADLLATKLAKKHEKNVEILHQEDNEARINRYNEIAQKFAAEAEEFGASVKAIEGDRVTCRTALLGKQQEITQKREGLNELKPEYEALEKDALHLGLKDTPASITSIYAGILTEITGKLAGIYNEMVADFDKLAGDVLAKIQAVGEEDVNGTAVEKKEKLAAQLEHATAIEAELPPLDEPYNELIEFKLNFKVKDNTQDVKNALEALITSIKHQIQSNDDKITSDDREARINSYNEKADVSVAASKELDAAINAVSGNLQEKQAALFELKKKVGEAEEQSKALTPEFEELEKDELHLSIENTPDSIAAFFANLYSHIESLIHEIDSALAAEKGLEISEEQLAEFRDTFTHFDRDGSKTLEYFELKACLTALGEDVTDDQAKEYCRKYTAEKKECMIFDEYVKFMLEYFSKAETADGTLEAFKAIAQGMPVITEAQLHQYFSDEDVEFLKTQLKECEGGYEFADWVNNVYAK
jgi:actinin alpha